MNGTGDIPPLTQNNTTIDIDFCSLITIIPNLGMSSCRGRAEAFARSLSTKLRTLGTQNNENRLSNEESTSPVINGGAEAVLSKEQTATTNDDTTWLINNDNDNNSNNAQENILRPLRHDAITTGTTAGATTSATDTTFFDFDCDLESPGSPVDECEYLRLIETTSNTPHNSTDDDDNNLHHHHHYITNNDDVDDDVEEKQLKKEVKEQLPPIEALNKSNNNNNIKNINNNNNNNNNNIVDNNDLITTTTELQQQQQRKTTTTTTTTNNNKINNDNIVVINGHINDDENEGDGEEEDDDEDDEDDEEEITIVENLQMTENKLPLIKTNTTTAINIGETEQQTTTTTSSTETTTSTEITTKTTNDDNNDNIEKTIKNKDDDKIVETTTTSTNIESKTTIQHCGLDTTDDEDECRPQRVRRCSSLKTGKTPPGTPGRKKIVRFADKLGLDLADIKTFLDEIPNIPRSAYEDLEINELDPTISTTLNLLPKTDKLLVPLFQQPGGLTTFLDIVRERQVALENAAVTDPINQTITGYVRVRNLDFHKSVHVRYSLDHWRSYADLQANYIENSCDGFSDKFTFHIYGNSMHIGQRLELAVRFQCKGQQFWDNNYGANYCFQCLPATNSISTTTKTQPQTTITTTNQTTTTTHAYNIPNIVGTQPPAAYNQLTLQQQQQQLHTNNTNHNNNVNFNYYNINNSVLRLNQCQGQGVIHLQGQMHAIGLCSPTTVDAWCNSFY